MGDTLYHEHNWYFNNWCYCHSFFHSCFIRTFSLLLCLSSLFTRFEALECPMGDLILQALNVCKIMGFYYVLTSWYLLAWVRQPSSDCADDLLLLVLSILPFSSEFNVKLSMSQSHEKQGNIGSFHYIQGVTRDGNQATQRLLDFLVSFSQMTLNSFLVYSSLCSCGHILQCCKAYGWGAGRLREEKMGLD